MARPLPFLPMRPIRQCGFTWIELVMVLAMLGILGLIAIPSMQDAAIKRQVRDAIPLSDVAKKGVQAYYSASGDMPKDNKEAGIPDKDKIVSTLIKEVRVNEGAITMVFGNNASTNLHDKMLTLRPAMVKDTPATPIAWICAEVSVPTGMEVKGKNITDIKANWLPLECRGPETTK